MAVEHVALPVVVPVPLLAGRASELGTAAWVAGAQQVDIELSGRASRPGGEP
ncbi:MAG: hypothetical protein ACRDZN_00855 [Acidimicrobiales bacterium]